jgi:hypothetical protein
MKLYIEVVDGKTVSHPALEENLLQAFPDGIPTNFESFVRTTPPLPGLYQKLDMEGSTYEKIDGVWTDVWVVSPISEEEKMAIQQGVKDQWAARDQAENWSAWTFDEESCSFVPPIPRPEPVEGKIVFWCGAENNWKETPPYPQDGKQYRFDFFAWTWVEVTE